MFGSSKISDKELSKTVNKRLLRRVWIEDSIGGRREKRHSFRGGCSQVRIAASSRS